MVFRSTVFSDVGLFDERFFMYPEDIDITRRVHRKYATVFYPYEKVIHDHGRASYKSVRMLFIHIRNMVKYFNKWGWFFDNERRRMNKAALSNIRFGTTTFKLRRYLQR